MLVFDNGGNYAASTDSQFFLLDHLHMQIFARGATVNPSLVQGCTETGF